MKKALIGIGMVLGWAAAHAQISTPSVIPVATAPTGTCANLPLYYVTTNGYLYGGIGGTCTLIATPSSASNCLSATTVNTPCVAYQHTFTSQGVSGGTGTITLYTSNSPANATFQICPNLFIGTAATGGFYELQVTGTTPGGVAYSNNSLVSISGTTAAKSGSPSCYTFALGANASFSFVFSLVSGTGSPSWETDPVVMRIY
jgi:hypothetical protein